MGPHCKIFFLKINIWQATVSDIGNLFWKKLEWFVSLLMKDAFFKKKRKIVIDDLVVQLLYSCLKSFDNWFFVTQPTSWTKVVNEARELNRKRTMATQTSLAMAGARVAGIPPVNVPGVLVNPPIRKKGFIGAISASGQSTGPFTLTFLSAK